MTAPLVDQIRDNSQLGGGKGDCHHCTPDCKRDRHEHFKGTAGHTDDQHAQDKIFEFSRPQLPVEKAGRHKGNLKDRQLQIFLQKQGYDTADQRIDHRKVEKAVHLRLKGIGKIVLEHGGVDKTPAVADDKGQKIQDIRQRTDCTCSCSREEPLPEPALKGLTGPDCGHVQYFR